MLCCNQSRLGELFVVLSLLAFLGLDLFGFLAGGTFLISSSNVGFSSIQDDLSEFIDVFFHKSEGLGDEVQISHSLCVLLLEGVHLGSALLLELQFLAGLNLDGASGIGDTLSVGSDDAFEGVDLVIQLRDGFIQVGDGLSVHLDQFLVVLDAFLISFVLDVLCLLELINDLLEDVHDLVDSLLVGLWGLEQFGDVGDEGDVAATVVLWLIEDHDHTGDVIVQVGGDLDECGFLEVLLDHRFTLLEDGECLVDFGGLVSVFLGFLLADVVDLGQTAMGFMLLAFLAFELSLVPGEFLLGFGDELLGLDDIASAHADFSLDGSDFLLAVAYELIVGYVSSFRISFDGGFHLLEQIHQVIAWCSALDFELKSSHHGLSEWRLIDHENKILDLGCDHCREAQGY